MFSRSAQNLNLTPAERAFLKLVEGFVVAALVAALPVLSAALAQNGLNPAVVLPVAGGAFVKALFDAILKYCKAFGDPALPTQESAPSAASAPADVLAQVTAATDAQAQTLQPAA